MDVCGFQLASKTPFRSAFEAVQLLIKVSLDVTKAYHITPLPSHPVLSSPEGVGVVQRRGGVQACFTGCKQDGPS